MSARILDGKAMADTILAVIHDKVAEREAQGKRRPGLAVILVGDDAASAVYVRNKKRACERAGVTSVSHDLPSATTQEQVLALIDTLNADPAIDGILVQLPLPAHIDAETVIERIRPGQGRRRLPPLQHRPPGGEDADAAALHPARHHDAAARHQRGIARQECGDGRAHQISSGGR